MKISIYDFKGIDQLDNYNLETVNVLTGANSGGKSSLIHLLLLLKQSMDAKSTASPLKLNHPYVTLGKFEQIVSKFSATEGFGFKLTLSRAELDSRLRRLKAQKKRMVAPDVSDATVDEIHGLEVEVRFKKPTDKVVVDFFKLKLLAKAESTFELRRNQRGGRYKLSMSEPDLFLLAPARRNDIAAPSSQEVLAHVAFASFFPLYVETESTFFDTSFPMDLVRFSIQKTLNQITYIGPLREEPKDFYFQDDDLIDAIGNKGENAAYLLAKYADHKIAYKIFDTLPDGRVMLRQAHGSLMDAMNYWMCDVFKLAKKSELVAQNQIDTCIQ